MGLRPMTLTFLVVCLLGIAATNARNNSSSGSVELSPTGDEGLSSAEATPSTVALGSETYDTEEVGNWLRCDPGYFYEASTQKCTKCAYGSWSSGIVSNCVYQVNCTSDTDIHAPSTEDCVSCASVSSETAYCKPMDCSPGTEPNTAASTALDCSPCELGTFSPGGVQPCISTTCPVGFHPTENASDPLADCIECPRGMSSEGNASLCAPPPCEAGHEPNETGTSCLLCSAGMYSIGNGSFCLATHCPPGSAAPEGATHFENECELCDSGFFSLGGDMQCDNPTTCAPGWAAAPGATSTNGSCSECSPGSFSYGGSMQCTPTECAPGSGSVEGASTPTESCSVCVAGFYSPGGGHPCMPVECADGRASSDAGATSALDSCVECPAGSFSVGGGAQCEATSCIPGTASPSGAFSVDGQCALCSAGFFSPGGEAQCQSAMCPTGSAAPPGAATIKGDCMQCAEGFHSAGGASPCLACECAAGFSCKGGQPVCKKCYAGQTAAGGSDRCGSKDAPTNYVELAMELEGYTASMFNDEVSNALATGLRAFLTAAASVSSLDGAEDEIVCTERSVETPEPLKESPWGASYVSVDITLSKNVVPVFEAFLKVYEAPANDPVTTSNSTNVTDGNGGTIDVFVVSLRSHRLARLRSAQLQQVVAWQNGEEVARVGSSSSHDRTLLPLVLSIGVGVAVLLVVVIVIAVRVGHRHASQSRGSLESGRRETLDDIDGFDMVAPAASESMQDS